MSENYNRREFLKKAALSTALLSIPYKFNCSSAKKQPNIILVYVDDWGWKDAGFMGSKYYETPNMDKLASEGMVFTNAYSNAPNCAPSRACLLTGLYGPRHGVFTVSPSARGKSRNRKIIPVENSREVAKSFDTVADVLSNNGYKCGSFGKWHLGSDPENGPLGQGFDINVGGNRTGHPKSYFSPYKNPQIPDGTEGEYLTDRLNNEALNFIDENNNNPFFQYLAHYAVHTPIRGKKDIIEKYRNKNPDGGQNNPVYAAMIESVDAGLGRIMEKLKNNNLEDETVLILYSDNGGYGPATSMSPLRGSKGMMYEGGIRVPLIIKWPGKIQEGSICEEPVIGTDFFPTFLDIAGIQKTDDHELDGETLIPLLRQNGKLDREAIFWHFPAYLEAYRGMDGFWRTTPAGAVRKGDWKLIEYFEDGTLELYNLREDIGEVNDLSEQNPEKRIELHQLMIEWREETGAPVPTQLNPEYNPEK